MIRPWKPIVGRIIQANPWSRPVSSNLTIQLPVPTSKYLDIIPQEQKLLIGGPPTASRSGLLLLRSNDLFLIAGIPSLAIQDQTVYALEACLAPQRSTRRLQKMKSVFSCVKMRQWEETTFEHRKANTPYGRFFSQMEFLCANQQATSISRGRVEILWRCPSTPGRTDLPIGTLDARAR